MQHKVTSFKPQNSHRLAKIALVNRILQRPKLLIAIVMHNILIELIGTKCLSLLTEIKTQKLLMAIGITVGNLDNRNQCFTVCCCLDVFAGEMKHNVAYLQSIHFSKKKYSKAPLQDFFLCSNWL